MTTPLLTAVILILSAYITVALVQLFFDLMRGYSYTHGVRGPVRWGPLGNSVELLWNHHRLYDWIMEMTTKFDYKPWTFKVPLATNYVILTEPSHIEFALKTNFASFEKGPHVFGLLCDLLGIGIFNSDGEQWNTQRKVTSQIFHVKNFRDFFMQVFREEGVMLLAILKKHASDGTVLDLYDLFHRFTLESFARIGFGIELDLLRKYLDGDNTPVPFAAAFDKAQATTQKRFFNAFWWWTELLTGTKRVFDAQIHAIDQFAYGVIKARKKDPGAHEKSDLLSRFVSIKSGESGQGYTDKELRDVLMNLIIAGRDTTAQGLSWTFFELFQNRELFTTIRNEIRTTLPGFNPYIGSSPSYDEILQLKVTKSVFMEALRLHPSVPLQPKVAVEDVAFPDGLCIPRGVHIIYSSYLMGRRCDVWGEDALEFNAKRFVSDPNPNQFKYPVFNAGPRLCLGMNMAYLEAVTVLAMTISEFDFEPAMDLSKVQPVPGLTLLMKDGLRVRVKSR